MTTLVARTSVTFMAMQYTSRKFAADAMSAAAAGDDDVSPVLERGAVGVKSPVDRDGYARGSRVPRGGGRWDSACIAIDSGDVRKGGHSVYKNPKETITIWGAYDILENKLNCRFPEKPDLELLHEERNNIQHKNANPSAEDAAFYIERAMKFIDRFAREELGLALADFLPSDFLAKVL